MKLQSVHLHVVRMPLVSPFTTSFAKQVDKDALLVEVRADVGGTDVVGWGECVAIRDPFYSSEYVAGSIDVIRRYLAPRLLAVDDLTAQTVATHLEPFVGHRMSKAALEMAVLDAELRARGESLARHLGATVDRVPSGVSVGIQDSVPELLDHVAGYVAEGYQRIKLKIRPGWDVEPVGAVREAHPDVALQVDANAAYTLADAPTLGKLDAFDLLLVEQPLAEDDLREHALLARRMTTPMCLDESIVSAKAAVDALVLGAADVINIKPGRVGGYLEARRIHDIARAHGAAVWCGGMLETGLGRAANAALAALPGFTLPGDISASGRFYAQDVTEPIVLEDGHIRVPTGPGLGVEPIPEVMEELTISTETVR